MRMFDSETNINVITGLSAAVAVINLFTIYTIWKYSPNTMGQFKYYMLKMAISDFLFSISIGLLYLPNLLFPLPAASISGLLRFIPGQLGGHTATLTAGGMMLLSVTDCCLFRVFLFYKMDIPLEVWSGNWRYAISATHPIITAIVLVGMNVFTMNWEETQDYVKRNNLPSSILNNISSKTCLIAFDIDTAAVKLSASGVGIFLVCCEITNIGSCYLVQRKINQAKGSMSRETFRMHRSLTWVLMAQILIPAVSISIPVIIYMIGLFFDVTFILSSIFVEWIVVIIIGAYPFVNSVFCVLCIKAYRPFWKRVIWRAFCCKEPPISAVRISEISRSRSDNS